MGRGTSTGAAELRQGLMLRRRGAGSLQRRMILEAERRAAWSQAIGVHDYLTLAAWQELMSSQAGDLPLRERNIRLGLVAGRALEDPTWADLNRKTYLYGSWAQMIRHPAAAQEMLALINEAIDKAPTVSMAAPDGLAAELLDIQELRRQLLSSDTPGAAAARQAVANWAESLDQEPSIQQLQELLLTKPEPCHRVRTVKVWRKAEKHIRRQSDQAWAKLVATVDHRLTYGDLGEYLAIGRTPIGVLSPAEYKLRIRRLAEWLAIDPTRVERIDRQAHVDNHELTRSWSEVVNEPKARKAAVNLIEQCLIDGLLPPAHADAPAQLVSTRQLRQELIKFAPDPTVPDAARRGAVSWIKEHADDADPEIGREIELLTYELGADTSESADAVMRAAAPVLARRLAQSSQAVIQATRLLGVSEDRVAGSIERLLSVHRGQSPAYFESAGGAALVIVDELGAEEQPPQILARLLARHGIDVHDNSVFGDFRLNRKLARIKQPGLLRILERIIAECEKAGPATEQAFRERIVRALDETYPRKSDGRR